MKSGVITNEKHLLAGLGDQGVAGGEEEPAWDNNFQKFDHEVAINQTNKINELVDAVNELRVEGRRWKLL